MTKKLLFIGKICLTVIILYFIFRRIDLSKVLSLSSSLKPADFIFLLLTTALKLATQYINWAYCLKINKKYALKKGEVLRSLFIGHALRFLVPGGHGTFGKVYFVDHQKKEVFLSIGVEKFVTTWSILFFGSWAALFYFDRYSIVLRLAVLIIISFIPIIVYHSKYFFSKHGAYFDNYIKVFPRIISFQTLYILLTVFQYFLLINRYQVLSFIKALISVPLILTANTIPITYSGLGLRETFSMHLLADFGIKPEVAVTASLLIFFINSVIPGLIGAYLMLHPNKPAINT